MTPLWLDRILNKTVLISRRVPAGLDKYGNITYDEETSETRGFIRPLAGSDIQFGRAMVGTHVLVLPAEAASLVDGFARYVIDGVVYEAEGPGDRYSTLHATDLHHIEINLVQSSA